MKLNKKFFLMAVCVGAAYGYVGGVMNENPYYAPVYSSQPNTDGGIHWKPSKCWITSYLLCSFEIGVRNTRSGFMFFTADDRNKFLSASSVIGALFGVGLFIVSLIIQRVIAKPSERGSSRSQA